MRYIPFMLLLVFGSFACQSQAPEPARSSQRAIDHYGDLGELLTPWGTLHVFDRLKAVHRVPPRYPMAARRAGITGTVLAVVLISETGEVEDVNIQKSSGEPSIDAAAVEALRHWKYPAGIVAGRCVSIQPISFSLSED